MRRAVLAAVVLVLGAAVAPTDALTGPRGDVLLLEAAGYPAATSFATDPARRYTITATGVYTYDGTLGLGLADCGHKDPESEAGWMNVANVLLDGRPAACSVQPVSGTHTYTWQQRGTGRPFGFVVLANAYTADDTGCLVIQVYDAAAPAPAGVPLAAPTVPGTCWRLA